MYMNKVLFEVNWNETFRHSLQSLRLRNLEAIHSAIQGKSRAVVRVYYQNETTIELVTYKHEDAELKWDLSYAGVTHEPQTT